MTTQIEKIEIQKVREKKKNHDFPLVQFRLKRSQFNLLKQEQEIRKITLSQLIKEKINSKSQGSPGEHQLLLKLISLFIDHEIEANPGELTDSEIEQITKLSGEL